MRKYRESLKELHWVFVFVEEAQGSKRGTVVRYVVEVSGGFMLRVGLQRDMQAGLV